MIFFSSFPEKRNEKKENRKEELRRRINKAVMSGADDFLSRVPPPAVDDEAERFKFIGELREVLLLGGINLRSTTIAALWDLVEDGVGVDGVMELLSSMKQTKTLALLMNRG